MSVTTEFPLVFFFFSFPRLNQNTRRWCHVWPRADVASCQSPSIRHYDIAICSPGWRQLGLSGAKLQGKSSEQVGVIWKWFDSWETYRLATENFTCDILAGMSRAHIEGEVCLSHRQPFIADTLHMSLECNIWLPELANVASCSVEIMSVWTVSWNSEAAFNKIISCPGSFL